MRYFVCRRKRGYKSMKNKAINAMCRKGTSYAPRKKTDVLFQMPAGSFNYKGMADRSARDSGRISDKRRYLADVCRAVPYLPG